MDETSTARARSRSWRAVSLRVSLLLVLIAALALGWLAWILREQREIKEMILRNDGQFFYEYEPQTVTRYTRETWVPAWLRSIIGEDHFHDVTWVRIEGRNFGDAQLERLRSLDHIETLGIVQTAITDAGLRHLSGRHALKGLCLGGNWIGDAGIDNLDLKSLPKLELLEIRSTLVTPAKIKEIKTRFPKLMILTDGPSRRFVVPGKGRGPDRMVNDSPLLRRPDRKVPPRMFGND